ncbi:MAG: 2'-5' RNA ligase family protein [Patescibacteria group bacterium]
MRETEPEKYGIVLLPPPDVQDWLQQLNIIVNAGMAHPPLVLGSNHLPHVSLAHLYVADPFALVEPLTRLLQSTHPLAVSLSSLSVDTIGQHTWSSVVIQDTPVLHQLHIDVMNTVLPFETRPSRYRDSCSYDKFWPHVTVGVDSIPTDMEFSSRRVIIDRVALARMGRPYATCDAILREWTLI